jgi:hypothetical protein
MEGNSDNINWPHLLNFQELTQFLDRKNLLELSRSNRHIRDRLNPLIFRSICLSRYSLKNHFVNTNGNEVYKQALNKYNIYIICNSFGCKCDKSKFKDLEHEPMLKTLEFSLLRIRKYVKSFKLSQLQSFGCFAFSLIYNLNNLENLEIERSSIYYNDIINLSKNLEKLKALVLNWAQIFHYKKYTEASMFSMPRNLVDIDISQYLRYENASIHGIYECVKYLSNNIAYLVEIIFPITITSLKRL